MTEQNHTAAVAEELKKFMPSEIICNEAFLVSGIDLTAMREENRIAITERDAAFYDDDELTRILYRQFKVKDLKGLGLSDFPVGALAGAAALKYLQETQKMDLSNIRTLSVYIEGNYVMIDASTRRNLELIETLRDKRRQGSLIWVLDKTKTAMGARLLRQFIEQPLIKKEDIIDRQDSVGELLSDVMLREEIREYLDAVYDLERLMTRVVYHTANPRDMIALKNSLAVLFGIKGVISDTKSSLLAEMASSLDPMSDIYELLEQAINDDAPVGLHDGDIDESLHGRA